MPSNLPTLNLPTPAALHLDQYLGLWAMDETRATQLYQHVSRLDVSTHIEENQGRNIAAAKGENRGQIEIIEINGTITKRGSSLSRAGSTIQLRKAIRQASNDPEISAIVLRVDSPGGTVAGVADLAAEINAANRQKPVIGFVEDFCASAGYWLISQCREVYANNRTAEIGSIGVYMGLYDVSRMAENDGIKAVVIRTSSLKGAGFPGEQITEEQQAVWQESVDSVQAEFTSAVQSGRNMTAEEVATVATGRVFAASQAVDLKLIDGIKTFEETLAYVQSITTSKPKGKTMASATYLEILEACDGIDPKQAEDAVFLAQLMDQESTAEQAAKAWMGELKQRAATAREDAEKAAKAKPAGVEPLVDEPSKPETSEVDAKEQFWAIVEKKEAQGMDRQKAITKAAIENPQLHQAYLAESNKS